jgi:ribosomal protein L29
MKRTEIAKLREKPVDELTGMVKDLREAMLKARIARAMEGKQVGVGYRASRRQIARIQTILAQKAAGAPAPAAPAPKASAEKPAPKKKAAGKKPAAATEKA